MASPLVGIAAVNSLLFAAYGASKRIVSPFGQISLKETAAAGAMAGAANAILASPGSHVPSHDSSYTERQADSKRALQWRCSKFVCRANMARPQISG